MPNKFLIETALDIGIANLERTRKTDPKKLYEEVKSAISDESSVEMQSLYRRYMSLYEDGLKFSTQATATLKDELKWKHLGDLREAVKKGGKGLNLADIEWLNQFALAEYARQERDISRKDDNIIGTLKEWFHIYDTLKTQSIEISTHKTYKEALRSAFLGADKVPFTFQYREGTQIFELEVTLKGNKMSIGKRDHALVGESIIISDLAIDAQSLSMWIKPKDADKYLKKIPKQKFLDIYLDDILAGKDIRIQDQLVHIQTGGVLDPRRIGTLETAEVTSLDAAIKKWLGTLVSWTQSEPLIVSHEGKKYRFPLKIDEKWFSLGGRTFTMSFPNTVKQWSFEFDKDEVIFSGKQLQGSSRKIELMRVKKVDVIKQLDSQKNDIKFWSPDGDIIITANGKGEYLPPSSLIADTPALPVTVAPVWSGEVLKPSIELKWSIEAYAGWNQQELAKVGKTVKDLKLRLKELGFYKGEPDEIYDIATLNAVVAFQTAKRLNKIDGLAWITETIPALFGQEVPKQLNQTPWTESWREPPGWSGWAPAWWGNGGSPDQSAPATGWRQGWSPEWSEAPRSWEVEPTWAIREMRDAFATFESAANAYDKWFGALRQTRETVDAQAKEIRDKVGKVITLCERYKNAKDPTVRSQVAVTRLNLSYYLSWDYKGISNDHFKNLPESLNQAVSVLNMGKNRIAPVVVNDMEIAAEVAKSNPELAAKIQKAASQNPGKPLFEILSNPLVKWWWESAHEAILGKKYAEFDTKLKTLSADATLSPVQRRALDHCLSLRGQRGWWDWKAEHTTAMWQILKVWGATAVGALATSWMWWWGGLALGATVATTGSFLARGYADAGETVIDGFINTLSFWWGALIVKAGLAARGTQLVQSMGKAGATATIIGIDGLGNIGVWISGDMIRANLHGEDLRTWDSLKTNVIPWAIMAMYLHRHGVKMSPQVIASSERVVQSTERAWVISSLGWSPQQELAAINAEKATLQEFAQAHPSTQSPPVIPPKAPAQAVAWAPKPPTTYVEWTHTLNNGDKVTIKDGRYSIADRDWNPKWWNTLGSLEETLQTNGTNFRPGEGRVMNPTPAPAHAPQATVDLGKWTIATDAQGIQYTRHTDGALYKKTPDAWAQWETIDALAVPWDIQSQLPAVAPHPAPTQQSATWGVEHPPPATPRATVSPVQSPLSDISGFIQSSIPKNAKPGEAIKMGDITITPLKSGQYKVEYKGKTHTFDNLDSLGRWVNQLATTPLERAKLMASTNTKMMDNHLVSLNGKVVPWTEPPIRIIREGEWTMVLEVQEGHGWWTKKTIDSLTEEEAISVLAQYTSKTPKQVRESIFRSNNTTLSNTVSHAEKEAFYKRWWKWAWESMEKWYKKWIDWTLNAWKTLANSPIAIFQLLTNWWHWTTWTKAFLTSWVMEWISMMLAQDSGISDWSFRDQEGNINWSNFGEAFAYAVIMANCGVTRWVIAAAWWTYYEFKNKSRLWAEVKP